MDKTANSPEVELKGIIFQLTGRGPMCIIHKESLLEYLSQFQQNEKGFIAFRFDFYRKTSRRGLFANIYPSQENLDFSKKTKTAMVSTEDYFKHSPINATAKQW